MFQMHINISYAQPYVTLAISHTNTGKTKIKGSGSIDLNSPCDFSLLVPQLLGYREGGKLRTTAPAMKF